MMNKIIIAVKKELFQSYICFVFIVLANFTVSNSYAQNSTLSPESQEAYNKGIMATKVPDYLLAIRYFEKARNSSPQSPEIYFNLGLAESKIPGRELRAIAWFGAYLTANPTAPNAASVKLQIAILYEKNQSNIRSLIKLLQDSNTQFITEHQFEVAKLFQKVGDISGTMEATDLIQKDYLKDNMRSVVVDDLLESGDITGALNTINLINDPFSKELAQMDVIYNQLGTGDVVGAKKTAELIQDDDRRCYAQQILIEFKAEKGDIKQAFKATRKIENNYILDLAYQTISKTQYCNGLDEVSALKTAELIKDPHIKSELLNWIAVKDAGLFNIPNALFVAGLITDPLLKDDAYYVIVSYGVYFDDIHRAQENIELIMNPLMKDYALGLVMEGQAMKGEIADALITSKLIVNVSMRYMENKWAEIAEIPANAGNIFGAEIFAGHILYNDLYDASKSKAMSSIAIAQANKGDIVGAKKTAVLITDPYFKIDAQISIANAENYGVYSLSSHIQEKQKVPLHLKPQPAIKVSDWLKILNGTDDSQILDCSLNTKPFLELPDYLKSLFSLDAQQYYQGIFDLADKIIKAQNETNEMLKLLVVNSK